MRFFVVSLSLAALATPFSASAQQRTGYSQIVSGDLKRAEQTLVAERRVFPQSPELMLNLAAVYQQTGRLDQARSLYDMVLGQPEVMMDMSSDRIVGSHAIARTGLGRLADVKLSSR
ncbi:tetratricopeptide repeat protein [Sphingomonas endolithica]|uniref:tetratricopeptide repeat protein n=1 Tax=Sphingomonas endolithica TaxID=2972485 RepID=UPI0021AE4AAA|nr:tetratricopeptide repeat protein [Sphingomonas sp. ZFBP2030]